MPDWFYRTISQPILFRLPAPQARDFALGFIGRLARLPLGPLLIDFLGHMRADPRLCQSILDTDFPTTVGLGHWLDTNLVALEALSRFGVGFIEIGPVSLEGTVADTPVKRLPDQQGLWFAKEPGSISLAECNRRLGNISRVKVPVIVRLSSASREETEHLLRELNSEVRFVALNWSSEHWPKPDVLPSRKLLLCITADQDPDEIGPWLTQGFAGLLVDGSVKAESDGRVVGLPVREVALRQVRKLREVCGANIPIIASSGIHEPAHALELLAAGANLIQVDTGLIYTGPGLPKRINDSLLFEATRQLPAANPPPRATELTWFWTTLMGAGMFIGGLLALAIAATKVMLPYDEAFLGISQPQVTEINEAPFIHGP